MTTTTLFTLAFTGTRYGMTRIQVHILRAALYWIEDQYGTDVNARHGGCIGSDITFHAACVSRNWAVDVFPSTIPNTQGDYKFGDRLHIHKPAPPLQRNTTIIRSANMVIATPNEDYERLRSGTWSTIRKVRTAQLPLLLILPSRGHVCEWPMSQFSGLRKELD